MCPSWHANVDHKKNSINVWHLNSHTIWFFFRWLLCKFAKRKTHIIILKVVQSRMDSKQAGIDSLSRNSNFLSRFFLLEIHFSNWSQTFCTVGWFFHGEKVGESRPPVWSRFRDRIFLVSQHHKTRCFFWHLTQANRVPLVLDIHVNFLLVFSPSSHNFKWSGCNPFDFLFIIYLFSIYYPLNFNDKGKRPVLRVKNRIWKIIEHNIVSSQVSMKLTDPFFLVIQECNF